MSSTEINENTPLFRVRALRLILITRFASTASNQMLAIVLGWQIYDLTNSALALGMIGLVQFLPPLLLTLVSGEVADRVDRRTIVRWTYVIQTIVTLSLLGLTLLDKPPVAAFYIMVLLLALARTFEGPANQALLPSLVPREILSRSVAAYSSASRVANLTGPSIGGLIYGFGAATDYAVCLVLIMMAAIASFMLPAPAPLKPGKQKVSWETMIGGLVFVWNTPILLGVLSLDLMATFFGGVAALLPIFARDVLDIGPVGFGILRSSPSIGALLMALILAKYPINRAAGQVIFGGVVIYGIATIIFALSHNVLLSICTMFMMGAGDTISQVNRKTLLQVMTPDSVRGRVSAVSSLSVNIGGQLGQFESGVTAAMMGTVGSVLFGGCAVLCVVALWAWRFPDLRRVERADEMMVAGTGT
jgi:MFS family permease